MNTHGTLVKPFDASHLMYRMHFTAKGITPDPAYLGKTTIFLFFQSIMATIRDDLSYFPVFLFDAKDSTKYRKDLDEKYKSNRTPNWDVINAKTVILKLLKDLNIFNLEVEGLEADDIGYLMSRMYDNPLLFVTEDVDWYSYITERNYVYRPISSEFKNFSDLLRTYGPILDQLGWEPTVQNVQKLLTHRKALLGDKSDKVSGWKGLGAKTANTLLVKLNKGEQFSDFKPKGKIETKFYSELPRFERNIKVLGYEHLHDIDISSYFKFNIVERDVLTIIQELAESIESEKLMNKAQYYTDIINKSLINTKIDLIPRINSNENLSEEKLIIV